MTDAQIDKILDLVNAHRGEYYVMRARALQTMGWADAIKAARRELLTKYHPAMAAKVYGE